MVAEKGKKLKISAKGEENIQFDGDLVLSIEKLQEIQEELRKINEEASDKILEVEQKYNEMRKPIYNRRNGIIKSIPDFWLTAFMSHPALGQLLKEEDQKIFKYLCSLEVEDFKDVKMGYLIKFNFKSNPYFENSELIKTFIFRDEGMTEVASSPIKWKQGMGFPNGITHENKGKKRLLDDTSFFDWFDDDRDLEVEIQNEVADIIKDDLWPNPISYFDVGDADEEDSDVEANEDDGSDDELNSGGTDREDDNER